MNDKIKFGDLHWTLKIAIVVSFIQLFFFIIGFSLGILEGMGI